MIVEFLILVIILLTLFYYWATKHYDFFKKQGIPYHKPFPLFGSMKEMVFRQKSFLDGIVDLYNMHDGK